MAFILPVLAFFGLATAQAKEEYRVKHHILAPCDTDSDCDAKNPWVGPNFM